VTLSPFITRWLQTTLVIVPLLAATLWTVVTLRSHDANTIALQTDARVAQIESQISSRWERCRDALWGARGLLLATHNVTKPSWHDYVGYVHHELGDTLEQWKTIVHPDDHAKIAHDWSPYHAGLTTTLVCDVHLRHLHPEDRSTAMEWFTDLKIGRISCIVGELRL